MKETGTFVLSKCHQIIYSYHSSSNHQILRFPNFRFNSLLNPPDLMLPRLSITESSIFYIDSSPKATWPSLSSDTLTLLLKLKSLFLLRTSNIFTNYLEPVGANPSKGFFLHEVEFTDDQLVELGQISLGDGTDFGDGVVISMTIWIHRLMVLMLRRIRLMPSIDQRRIPIRVSSVRFLILMGSKTLMMWLAEHPLRMMYLALIDTLVDNAR